MNDTYRSSRDTFVPAIDDIISPPPPTSPYAEPKPTSSPDVGLGFVITAANILVTLLIIAGMMIDGQQVGRAIVTGAVYFAGTSVAYMLLITGALASMFAAWQQQKTERHRVDAYADMTELALRWRMRVESNRRLELTQRAAPLALPDAGGLPTPSRPDTFVPAYESANTPREALAWVEALYGEDGQPDPEKVQMQGDRAGWLKVRMLGSKRGTGSKEAGLWLLQRGVIVREQGGYALNIRRYPYRSELRRLL